MSEKYNGWTNYETWLVKLWMDNGAGSYEYWREYTREFDEPYDLGKSIQEDHEAAVEELVNVTGVFSDLLNGALSAVNWYEIAEHLIEDSEDV